METVEDKTRKMRGMADFWGGGSNGSLDGRTAFCRISSVDPTKRTCTIKTHGSDPVTANADYSEVQWLNPYSSVLGDEISFVPEAGAQGLVLFAGGVPWIVGFFQPITLDPATEVTDKELEGVDPSGGSAAQNKEQINVGDFILRTAGRCRLVMRRGGEIELEATKLCRRTFFPTQNLINELCQNYEFRTDGGTIDWRHIDKDSDKTVCRTEWRDDIARTNVIVDQKGSVKRDTNIIHLFQIGPGKVPNIAQGNTFSPVYAVETLSTGQTHFNINGMAYDELIKADGEYELGINGYTFYQNIKPDGSLRTNINNKFQMVTLPSGETTLDIGIPGTKRAKDKPDGGTGKFHLNIKPDGTMGISIADKISMTLKSDGNMTIDSGPGGATILIDPTGAVSLTTKTVVTITTKTVDIKASLIKLGESVSDVIPLGKLFLAALNKFIVTFNLHVHPPMLPLIGGPIGPPTTSQKQLKEDILSATVKVQA